MSKSLAFIEAQMKLAQWRIQSGNVKTKQHSRSRAKGKSRWTGTAVELVEYAYASIEAKSFNDGNIQIIELINDLCDFFGFNVNDCYRAMADIKRRPGDRTKYLDKLKGCLMYRLEQSDKEREKRKRP